VVRGALFVGGWLEGAEVVDMEEVGGLDAVLMV